MRQPKFLVQQSQQSMNASTQLACRRTANIGSLQFVSPTHLLAAISALSRRKGELSKDDALRNLRLILSDLARLTKSLRTTLKALTEQRNIITFIDPRRDRSMSMRAVTFSLFASGLLGGRHWRSLREGRRLSPIATLLFLQFRMPNCFFGDLAAMGRRMQAIATLS
jgi:hypothetical protein